MRKAEPAELATMWPTITAGHMTIAIGDSLSNHACSKTVQYGHDENDEDTELGKLSEDDQPGWVVATMSISAHQQMQSYTQMWMKLDELTQLG